MMMYLNSSATLMGGHKGQAIHYFDKIFKLAVVVNEDSEPLLLDVSPDGLFLMKVVVFHLSSIPIKCLIYYSCLWQI